MIKVDENKYKNGSCWQIACDESKLSLHVPITTSHPPNIDEIAMFCSKNNIRNNFHYAGNKQYWSKEKYWPKWLDLPWRNIVIMTQWWHYCGGHAESIHSKTQYNRLRKQYARCIGVIDVGGFAVDCYKYKTKVVRFGNFTFTVKRKK